MAHGINPDDSRMNDLNDEKWEAALELDYTDNNLASSKEGTCNSILDKIERTRTDLLDLSLRNPLLNYRPLKSRGVEVIDEIPSFVFDFLVLKSRPMSFLARQDEDQQGSLDLSAPSNEEPGDELKQPEEDDGVLHPRHTDSRLQTNESASQLQSRLLKTHHAANTLIQEQGVNTLYIALGMAEWYPSDASNIVRRAPLILVPVEITRSDVRGRFRIAYTGGELGSNLSFMEKVKNDFGVDIPDLPSDEDLEVDGYFDDVASLIEELDRWSVDRRSVVLGFFSFGKFLMYRDLDPTSWPDGTGYGPRESSIMRALFGGGFSEPDPKIGEEDRLDDHLRPEDIHHVVDADSSQALAILDVNQGRNLVIQGPPGTGKSQTIMNIIAEAIGNGRKVLFVSEKMAALEVVKHRLDAIGLGMACLELHSHKTTKRAVLDELKKTLDLGAPTVDGIEDDFAGLARLQSRLNTYAEAVNAYVGETGVTPFAAYGELIRIRDQEQENIPLPRVEIADMSSWTAAYFESKLRVTLELQTRLARVGIPERHLFQGSRLRILLPNGQAILNQRIQSAVKSLGMTTRSVRDLAATLGLSMPEDLMQTDTLLAVALRAAKAPYIKGVTLSKFELPSQREVMKHLVDAGTRWVSLHSAYDDILETSAWDADVRKTHETLSVVGRRFQSSVKPEFHLAPNNPSISQEWIDSGSKSLKTLTELAQQLAESLGLNPPEDTTQVAGLMIVAERAAKAPSIHGVDLSAFEQESQRDTMKRLSDAGTSWVGLHSQFDDLLDPKAWDADVRETHHALSTVGRKPWRFLSPGYRRAQRHLSELCLMARPDSIGDRLATVDAILQEQKLRRTFQRLSPVAGTVLGAKWEGQDSDWEAVGHIVDWALDLFNDVDNGTVAIDAVKALRDDIDARKIDGLLKEVAKATDSHAESIEALSSIIALDLEDEVGLLSLSFVQQAEFLDALVKENDDLAQANVSLSALFRAESPVGVERQIAVLKGILEEQELRRTFDSMSPVAEAALGPKWEGADSDWKSIGRIVEWALALFADVDGGVIPIDSTRSLRDDISPEIVGRLTDEVRATVDSHINCLDALQAFLEMDNSKRFRGSALVSLTNAGDSPIEGMITLSFAAQDEILTGWSGGIDGIHDLVGFNSAAYEAEKEGLGSLVELGTQWSGAAHHLGEVLKRAWYEHVLTRALKERPALSGFAGNIHEEVIGQFCSIDELALDHNRSRVAFKHWSKLPKYDGGGQLRTLRRQFERKRGHLPVRQLMVRAGNAIQAIKPVYMMSPMSIATYLPPGSVNFDLVVFDEASQVRPVDALGALMRADQAVVVGDSKQLPPTRFFDNVTQSDDDDDDSAVADMESILGLFNAEGAPDRMLRWHYRSRHESLIAVSNREFYENGLVVFPSPDSSRESIGLRYHHLPDTQYDRGRSSTNRKEAAAVAAHVMEHARQSPGLTLGVAAFSSAQREAIQDELERLRRLDISCEVFFSDHPEEPFFVKNLENVQGDERDVIFISIGYGRDAEGRVAMNFGPLTAEGGERRLNVLITRAKQRCHVFTNLRAIDIDLNRTSSRGVRALKTFLAYAETGVLEDMAGESGREIDSPFQTAVATRLRSRGYNIHEEVATGGKFIDLAVVNPQHPGRYILGIECDGASYHSSRSARDRDRLREQHLRNLGWRLFRIWSTDWFRNPERELDRAVQAIEQAKAATPNARPMENKNRTRIERVDGGDASSALTAQQYELAQPQVDIGHYELHEVPGSLLLDPIAEVVRIEGPVHVSEVRRRIADAVGVVRIGHRIKQNLSRAIGFAERMGLVVKKNGFLWRIDMNVPVIRDRGDIQRKRIKTVAPEEIAEALKMIVKHSYGMDRNEAVMEAARLLGFKKASKNTRIRIRKIFGQLIESGDFVVTGSQVTTSNQEPIASE